MSGRGRLIVFEGGEGTGKSTQAGILANHLGAELTREPGGTGLGERIRSVLLDHSDTDVNGRAELLLMTAARAQHVAEKIRPAIEAGRHVVCDRYSGSTLAYQGYGRGIDLDDVRSACVIAESGVPADLVILLDLPVEVGMSRLSGGRDRIERAGSEFHSRVVEGFRTLAHDDPAHWVMVDASGDPQEVADRVLEVTRQRFDDIAQSSPR